MKNNLHEGIDFTWTEVIIWGSRIQLPELVDGTILNSKRNPHPNQKVFVRDGHKLVPAIVIDGEYEVNGTITNQWSWRLLDAPIEIEKGEAEFFEFAEATRLVEPHPYSPQPVLACCG